MGEKLALFLWIIACAQARTVTVPSAGGIEAIYAVLPTLDPGDVVELEAGIYSAVLGPCGGDTIPPGVTIRGVGPNQTILDCRHGGQHFRIGYDPDPVFQHRYRPTKEQAKRQRAKQQSEGGEGEGKTVDSIDSNSTQIDSDNYDSSTQLHRVDLEKWESTNYDSIREEYWFKTHPHFGKPPVLSDSGVDARVRIEGIQLRGATQTSLLIFNHASVSLSYMIFNQNQNQNSNRCTYGGVAGAILLYDSYLELNTVLFFDNTAKFSGGAIFSHNGQIVGTHVKFLQNSANKGGAMDVEGPVSLSCAKFERNLVGGAVAVYSNLFFCWDCLWYHNMFQGGHHGNVLPRGGAIDISSFGQVELVENVLTSNTCDMRTIAITFEEENEDDDEEEGGQVRSNDEAEEGSSSNNNSLLTLNLISCKFNSTVTTYHSYDGDLTYKSRKNIEKNRQFLQRKNQDRKSRVSVCESEFSYSHAKVWPCEEQGMKAYAAYEKCDYSLLQSYVHAV